MMHPPLKLSPISSEKLGFPLVLEQLAAYCKTGGGKKMVSFSVYPLSAKEAIHARLALSREFQTLVLQDIDLPAIQFTDLDSTIQKLAIEGAMLEMAALHHLRQMLLCSSRWHSLLKKAEIMQKCPLLFSMLNNHYNESNRKVIDRVLDDNGEMKDQASKELGNIREQLRQTRMRLRRSLEQKIAQYRKEGMSPNDVEITIRNGRMVIPLMAEFKRKVKGFVHDESTTGQTVFMEPAESLEANNDIRELESEELREMGRILFETTSVLRGDHANIQQLYKHLCHFDLLSAIHRFADHYGCILPQISENNEIRLIQAKNPTLLFRQHETGKKVIPISLELDINGRILVISGPNAGGKSLCLKTVGLIQTMAQAGLPVPAAEESVFPVFTQIFTAIGDEQSIDNELSTYSSHLKNLKDMLLQGNQETLVLIDELGSGTDPELGSAMGEAILAYLHEKEVKGLVNTHHPGIKRMAANTPGFLSGAMEFDEESLSPTFRLQIGLPGNSFTFQIAANSGIPEDIITEAKKRLPKDLIRYEELVAELQKEKKQVEKQLIAAEQKLKNLDKITKEYGELKIHLESRKEKIIQESKEIAGKILADAREQADISLRRIKSGDREIVKKEKETLMEVGKSVQPASPDSLKNTSPVPFKKGDWVKLTGQDNVFRISQVNGNTALIESGGLTIQTKINQLEPSNKKGNLQPTYAPTSKRMGGFDVSARQAAFSPTLDIRGQRGMEAIDELQKYMDNAIMLGAHEVQIIHGKGDGILRKLVREYLRKNRNVVSVEDEHADRGGDGVSVVVLK